MLTQNGLEAKLFTNKYLIGLPYKTITLPDINHHFGAGLVSELPKQDFVSIEFNGFIKPPTTGQYYFMLHSNDGVRLYIDQ